MYVEIELLKIIPKMSISFLIFISHQSNQYGFSTKNRIQNNSQRGS